MVTAMLSTGNIRNYQILVGGLQLLNLPVDWMLLKAGCPPQTIFIVAIAIAVLCLCARLFMLRKMIGLDVSAFLREVLLREVAVAALAIIVPFALGRVLPYGWGGFAVSFLATELAAIAIIWAIGLEHDERHIITHKLFRR